MHTEGLMSIEGDIENPASPGSLFQQFPQTLARPYLDFATDLLRMRGIGTIEVAEMQVYAEHYIGGLMAKVRSTRR
jgi:hypothetical protein